MRFTTKQRTSLFARFCKRRLLLKSKTATGGDRHYVHTNISWADVTSCPSALIERIDCSSLPILRVVVAFHCKPFRLANVRLAIENVKGHLSFVNILDEYHLRKHPTTGQIVCNFHHNSAIPLPQKSNAELATSSKIGLSEVNDDKAQDFFALLERLQSDRLEDQRCAWPLPSAVASTSSVSFFL
ncbi:GoLoco domain containing protein [Trichuris trichiura]|uniref:GoLoco domain containing protein n=1 Tax=Trichuris trichiura TaxID=36087 RepID=A0A077ZAK3_TRITR|nr:GoLoco domain containing protein [Trichuris trichiura]